MKPGMDADLVLFNPDTVRDGATFEDPFGEPEGISSVFVAGKVAVKNGVFTGATAGKCCGGAETVTISSRVFRPPGTSIWFSRTAGGCGVVLSLTAELF